MKKENIPNPGSMEAFEKGCTCPVMDNNYGRGITNEAGIIDFWESADCPIHNQLLK